MEEPANGKGGAPYMSFRTLTNIGERLEEVGIPARIDRSFLGGSEGYKTQILAGLRFLGLIGEGGQVTPRLREFAKADDRRQVVGELIRQHYLEQLSLAENGGTQRQLEESFTPYGGETARKAASFFLQAAQYAEIPVSPHFATTRVRKTGTSGRRTVRPRQPRRRSPSEEPQVAPTANSDPRARYLDLLLKKADEEMDEKLLDRIERVIGVEATAASEENRD